MPPPPSPVPEGMSTSFVNAAIMRGEQEIGYVVYGDYLPAAMAARQFNPAPEAVVVGKGLEAVQEAMNQLGKGVSAKKLVVTL